MSIDWTLPEEDKKKKDGTDGRILTVIEKQKITFPAEIVGISGINRQTVFDRLVYLEHIGVIEKIDLVTKNSPPEALKKRLPELWARGLKGDTLRRMSWYRISKGDKGGKG